MKLILGLVWMLIQKYHIQAEDARRAMLDWIQVQYLCCVFFKFNKRVQIVSIFVRKIPNKIPRFSHGGLL